ncbi:MAG: photosynthetic reaction center subunit H [Pseudomonadota bacterium]
MSIGSIDLVEILFTLFWLFFIGLIIYLQREAKREGYPLEEDMSHGRTKRVRPNTAPRPKTFVLPHGGTATAPSPDKPQQISAKPAAGFPGAPLEPVGNPLLAGVGPGAYAERADVPDKTLHDEDRIVPMRIADEFVITAGDPDPRGWQIIADDGEVAGTVADLWVDRSEPMIMFYEADLGAAAGGRHVLVPSGFVRTKAGSREIHVQSLHAHQFADVPALKSTQSITLLEEEKIYAYFAAGKLYATAERQEPALL